MRIVLIITGLSTGGAEMMLVKVLERLDRQRFIPHVISLTTLGDLAPRIAALGIPVEALGMRNSVFALPVFFRLVRILKRLNPDAVHTWMYHADLVGGVAARLSGIDAVGWCIRNGNFEWNKARPTFRAVFSACALLSRWVPSRILSCSMRARDVHIAHGYSAEKMMVIPNGFDVTRFRPDKNCRGIVRAELGLGIDAPLVGMIGRFDPQKNHEGFIEAARYLHDLMPEVNFVLVGRGIDRSNSKLRKLIDDSGLNSSIHMLGLRDDMPCLMAALDVLASSSSYGEAFPNVLGEAMASGVPCAVTDIGDSAYIVGDTGRVVSSGDMRGLAQAMAVLLGAQEGERKALGTAARERVISFFEIGQIARQYEDFYLHLAHHDGRHKKSDQNE